MQYEIDRLQPAQTKAFSALTFPRYREMLAAKDAAPDVVAFGAWSEGQPIGLLLAKIDEAAKLAELLSVSTHRSYRRQGIASALLDVLLKHLQGSVCDTIVATFTQTPGKEASIASLLRKKGWSDPVLKMTLFDLPVEAIFTSPWVESVSKGPARFVIRPYDPENTADLEVVSTEAWVPPELAPAKHMFQGLDGAAILPSVSFVLYEDESITGWHFSHRLDAETIRFSVSYVRPDNQKDLALIELWYLAALGARELGYRRIKFGVAVHHRKMLSFCSTFLGPLCDRVSESLTSFQKLRFDDVWI